MTSFMPHPRPIEAPTLAGRPGVRHGFFTRAGGVSLGLYDSLNCGLASGDDRERVRANRARAADALGLAATALVTFRQIHSSRVVVVERPWSEDESPQADASVTRVPGIALSALAADCAPVLFADTEAGVIGAAHAGWRGALDGVLENTVAAMIGLGARPGGIVAALGPAIHQPSYEVGREFRDAFLAADPDNRRHFAPGAQPNKFQFDLPGYAMARLSRLALGQIVSLGLDTLADPDRFFSYRRTTLSGERSYGRLLSAIALA